MTESLVHIVAYVSSGFIALWVFLRMMRFFFRFARLLGWFS